MALPIFIDEQTGSINGSLDPQYNIGEFLNTGKLRLLNPITQNGTLHSASTMNNLINFGNDYSFPNCTKTVSFPTGRMLTEWRSNSTALLVASINFEFPNMKKTYRLYAENGIVVIQSREATITFPSGTIKTIVTL